MNEKPKVLSFRIIVADACIKGYSTIFSFSIRSFKLSTSLIAFIQSCKYLPKKLKLFSFEKL